MESKTVEFIEAENKKIVKNSPGMSGIEQLSKALPSDK